MQKNTDAFPGQRATMAMTTLLLQHHTVAEIAITALLKDLLTPNQPPEVIPAICSIQKTTMTTPTI